MLQLQLVSSRECIINSPDMWLCMFGVVALREQVFGTVACPCVPYILCMDRAASIRHHHIESNQAK